MGPFSPLSKGSYVNDSADNNILVDESHRRISKKQASGRNDSDSGFPSDIQKFEIRNSAANAESAITPKEAYENNFYTTQGGVYSQLVSHRQKSVGAEANLLTVNEENLNKTAKNPNWIPTSVKNSTGAHPFSNGNFMETTGLNLQSDEVNLYDSISSIMKMKNSKKNTD